MIRSKWNFSTARTQSDMSWKTAMYMLLTPSEPSEKSREKTAT
jgi:hypothetical protein